MNMSRIAVVVVILGSLFVGGCASTVPKDALKTTQVTLETRSMQTRKYEGISEADILYAASGIIQDLGFTIENSAPSLGMIVGSKDRDATDGGQVVAAVILGIISMNPSLISAVDDHQHITLSLVVRPESVKLKDNYYVRITIQRIIWNKNNQISKIEGITDPEIYQEFFSKLSKAVFLEGEKI